MFLELFLKGCLIGFSIAMPVGPIGLLCIRNSLVRGALFGFMSGLGAAVADTLYGAIGGFGLSFISHFLERYQLMMEFAGAIFLCYLGISTFREKMHETSEKSLKGGLWMAFFSTFLLTLTNPLTILSFAAIYAGIGVGSFDDSYRVPLFITLGVFGGSALWWLILSFASAILKDRIGLAGKEKFNKISGSLIFGLGAVILLKGLKPIFALL